MKQMCRLSLLFFGLLASVSSGQQSESGGFKEYAPSPDLLRPSSNQFPAAAVTVLEQADQLELLSLHPRFETHPTGKTFHGYRILSRTRIKDAKTRQKLIASLLQGMRENQGTIAACFNPRHGIHATHKGKRADLVICFECLQVQLFGDTTGEFLISRSPQPVFDGVLQSGGSGGEKDR